MLEVIVDGSGETVAIRRTFFRFTEEIKRFEKEGRDRMCTRCKKEEF
ncbi:hypothetical protein BCJMU10_5090 [Bacillus cereus]|nr:hypothetical protein BCJMU10_5090 [Bacillus cereus]